MAGTSASQPDAATVLKQMQQMQESLGVSLEHIEAAIAQREKRYLDDAQQAGNLVHGWEGITDSKSLPVRKSGSSDPANRIFSASSRSAGAALDSARHASSSLLRGHSGGSTDFAGYDARRGMKRVRGME